MANNLDLENDDDQEGDGLIPSANASAPRFGGDDQMIPYADAKAPRNPVVMSDSIGSSQAHAMDQGQDAPKARDISDLFVTKQDLQNAADQKRKLAMVGAIGDNLSNRQSFGNYFTGHLNPQTNSVSRYTNALAEQADQPIQQKQTLLAQEMKRPQSEYMTQASDPGSDVSKFSQQANVAQLQKVKSSLFANNPQGQASVDQLISALPGKSSYEIDQLMDKTGMNKILSGEAMTSDKVAQMMMALNLRQQNQDRNFDMKGQQFGAQIADKINKDPIETQSKVQLAGIQKGLSALNSDKVTNQTAKEVFQDMANILSQGRAAAQGTIHEQSYDNMYSDAQRAMSYLSGEPQDAVTPQVKQELVSIFNRLGKTIQDTRANNAKMLGSTYGSVQNPYAKQAISDAQTVRSTPAQPTPAVSQPQASPIPGVQQDEMQQALQWAKANPNNPKAMQIMLKLNDRLGSR